jgi:hypothetical protein
MHVHAGSKQKYETTTRTAAPLEFNLLMCTSCKLLLALPMQVIFLLSTISKSTTTRMQKGRIFGTAD